MNSEDLNYRLVTPSEFKEMVQKYAESTKVAKAKQIIKQYYPKAYKVFIRPASEYNDQGYDMKVVVLVLDKNMDELDSVYDISDTIQIALYGEDENGNGYEDKGEPYTFFMDIETEYPKLYIKRD